MTTHAPAPRRSADEQARLDAALADLFQRRIVFNQTLGLEIESARSPEPRIRLAMRPELVGNFFNGNLHGGVISAALDAMGGFADYLRPGVGASFLASAEVMRLGGRIGSTQMRLVNDQGTLIATAAAAYVIS